MWRFVWINSSMRGVKLLDGNPDSGLMELWMDWARDPMIWSRVKICAGLKYEEWSRLQMKNQTEREVINQIDTKSWAGFKVEIWAGQKEKFWTEQRNKDSIRAQCGHMKSHLHESFKQTSYDKCLIALKGRTSICACIIGHIEASSQETFPPALNSPPNGVFPFKRIFLSE